MSEERFIGIPTEKEFADTDWLAAGNIEKIADKLIEQKRDVQHLYDFKVAYFWKRAGGKKSGQPVIGQCSKVSGKVKAFAPGAHFMIWLAADHCREMGMTTYQAEAFVFHELLHTAADDKGRPIVVPHDWQGFSAEIREYGLYYDILQAAGSAFQQLRMLEA
jgi:hypothetical protein